MLTSTIVASRSNPGAFLFNKPMTYKIVRFYAPHLNKSSRVIQRGLTLEEAQSHCKDPDTRKAGEWFDGYDAE